MTTIDLAFELVGTTLPLDHGYSLFAALNRAEPSLHGDLRVGVHPIRGRQVAPGVLALTEYSRLRIRLPSERIAPYLIVAGSNLDLDGHRLRVGIPRVEALSPAPSLASRLVTFRNALDAGSFLDHVKGELSTLGIEADLGLVPSVVLGREGQPLRRVLRIKGRRVVGYALRVSGLSAEASLRLQQAGLGGRRRMGCGVFAPFEEDQR
jgi:CRISPR-associated protein Cas6